MIVRAHSLTHSGTKFYLPNVKNNRTASGGKFYLQHGNLELKRLNALRRERGKGVRVALKDRLLLTADDLQDTVYEMRKAEEEKAEQQQNKPPWKKQKKAAPPPPPSEQIDELLHQYDVLDSPNNSELE